MRKFIAAVMAVLCTAILSGCSSNYMAWDTVLSFNYAYILLPNGEVVEGEVEKWRDYEGEQVQVTIDGIVYLTDTTRAVLIYK